MTEKFNGTWEMVSSEGFAEFAKYLGLEDKDIELYNGKKTVITYKNEGNKIFCDACVEGLGSKVYECNLGETVDTHSLDGKKGKMSITLEGDVLKQETVLENSNQSLNNVKTVEGDTIKSVTTSADNKKSNTSVFKKK